MEGFYLNNMGNIWGAVFWWGVLCCSAVFESLGLFLKFLVFLSTCIFLTMFALM